MGGFLKDKKGIGVIICRMQVPYLTESHKATINTVLDRHSRVVIFLGVANKPIEFKNPYPFEFRKKMLEATFPDNKNLTIVPLPDNDDNPLWVKVLDSIIQGFLCYDEGAVLYGGRDSFIPWYEKDGGKHKCVELAAVDYDSGTELRQLAAVDLPTYTPEVAKTILWTLKQAGKV